MNTIYPLLVQLLTHQPECTFIDVEHYLESKGVEYKGNSKMMAEGQLNLIIWGGMNGSYLEAIEKLVTKGLIQIEASDQNAYPKNHPRLPAKPGYEGCAEQLTWVPCIIIAKTTQYRLKGFSYNTLDTVLHKTLQ